MMTKEEYKKELVRMWDSLREFNKGEPSCGGVACENGCPLYVKNELGSPICYWSSANCFEVIKAVEKWSKENPPKKHKVSRMEYDLLQTIIKFGSTIDTFNDFCTLRGLLDKGYFEGATGDMYISDYYNNCEVVD